MTEGTPCEVCGEPATREFDRRPLCDSDECLEALLDRLEVEDGE